MRVSVRWLKELVPELDVSTPELAERLTRAGLEVEQIQEIGAGLEPVVVAAVEQIEAHPKRSGLNLVTVERGGSRQRVVCGAANVPAPGGLVVLAPLGTTLSAVGMTLAPREIGGVTSEGMLCSERELGLAEDSEGILVLPAGSATPGTPLLQALPAARDTILEIGVTPNRPDALGHIGVAREVAALFGLSFSPPEPRAPVRTAQAEIERLVSVDNQDLERCPHYGAALVLECKVGPSPLWLRWRLSSLGVRPISNVVDVTNLILLGWGQPMHAFDLDRVREQRIVVRRARQGEPFTTLDGVERRLDADDLVICDAERPSALAGVMGGADSEIRDTTRRVLLECAYFAPRGIRRTSRRHALHTESSHRFERGIDHGAIERVLDHAKSLLSELAGGAAVPGAIHARGPEPARPAIRLRSSRLDQLLGVHVPFDQAAALLARLGFEVTEGEAGGTRTIETRAVSWRPDVSREEDLIEEVARVRGLDEIPTVLPAIPPQPVRTSGRIEREAARHAVALGLSQAVTYSFVSPRELAAVRAPAASVALVNPLTEERSVLRTSLLPGLLEALRRAQRHGERTLRAFSVGARFLARVASADAAGGHPPRPRRSEDVGVLVEERPSFAALLAGLRPTYLAKPEEVDVFDAKGVAVELVERLTGHAAETRHAPELPELAHLHPRGAALVMAGGRVVGCFGPLHPDVADAFDLDGRAQLVELDLQALEELGKRTPRHKPIPRLPPVMRDISLIVADDVPAIDVERAIRAAAGELCESVELFDLFRGSGVPEGHRSLAYHLTYRDPRAATDPDSARTLTDKEVDERHAQVFRVVTEQLGGRLRGQVAEG